MWGDQFDSVDEGDASDFVFAHTDHGGWCVRSAVKNRIDGFDTLHCGQHSVEGARDATALGMSQCGNTSIETEFLGEQVFEIGGSDGLEIRINGAFCNNHNRLTFSSLTTLSIRVISLSMVPCR